MEKAIAKWKDHLLSGIGQRLKVCPLVLSIIAARADRLATGSENECSYGRTEA
jgi:hypothetical protein